MERYARSPVRFLHALQNSFAPIEAVVVGARLARTMAVFRTGRWEAALPGSIRATPSFTDVLAPARMIESFEGVARHLAFDGRRFDD